MEELATKKRKEAEDKAKVKHTARKQTSGKAEEEEHNFDQS